MRTAAAIFLAAGILGLAGCSSSTSSDATSTRFDAAPPKDAAALDAAAADAGAAPDAMPPAVVRATITPTSATLVSVNGSMPSVRFSVGAVYSDGTTVDVTNADLRVEPVVLGQIDRATGTFTANGRFGGEGQVTARVDTAEASARILIRLQQETVLPGTPTTAPRLFDMLTTDPSREAQVVYPLDRAVMPQNVAPAEIQWLRSETGDVFRITLKKPNVQAAIFEATATPGFKNSWPADLVTWRRIAQSEPLEWADITVDRFIARQRVAIRGTPVRARFPRAALLGSIYYWDISRVRIFRINDGTTMRDAFMPNPQLGCIGCHAVSPSGRYMAGRLGPGENIAGVFDLTRDLSTDPPRGLFAITSTTIRWWFSAWNPTETRLIVSVWEQGGGPRALRLVDPFAGRFVEPAGGGLPAGSVTHPSWSPDGASIAYVANANNWGGENTSGDIYKLPVTGPDRFGAPVRVVSGTTAVGLPNGNAASYPTWSPDSAWIAFAHGSSSRSESGQSALYLVHADGAGLVRLTNASGGPTGSVSFQPRFSPFSQDGYFWLSFLSRRDYGNTQAGTAGSGRQQIWVTAVKSSPVASEDPSEVPFWLPGQDPGSLNISAYWAPRACREDRQSCAVDAECCSGDCAQRPMGGSICAPPSGMCRQVGDPCTRSDQCCNQVLCVDGTCGGL